MRLVNKYAIIPLALLLSATTQAGTIDLTDIGYVTYGDFQSYSLPIANLQVGCNTGNCPYDVASTPGAIKDLIVVATGASGTDVNTNFAGMDNAYSTPSGKSGSNFFSTGTYTDPNQVSAFTGDQATTWDTTLLALKNFLAGEDMLLFFNNNQLNGANLQSLAAWAQFEVVNYNGNAPVSMGMFDFSNNYGQYGLVSEGGGGIFLGDPTLYNSTGTGPRTDDGNAHTDYVLSGGPLCIDYDLIPGTPVPVSCSNPAADEGPINHNLGADQAAYAVMAPELNALLNSLFALSDAELANYTMHIDLRLGCDPAFGLAADEICTGALSGFGKNLNNGYEQLFIGTASSITRIPEPGNLLFILLGIVAIYCRQRYGHTRH